MANLTKLYLLSVPLDQDYAHTLHFAAPEAQQQYFQARIKKSYTDFSYQRKDKTARIPAHIDSLYAAGCNYAMYQNPDYNGKWFYAFITDMEYKNDEVTLITLKTDCLQTWAFDIEIKPSFVEREHAESDEIGEHTLEEGLELGEYISNRHTKSGYASEDLSIVIAATKTPQGGNFFGKLYNNMYSGVGYTAFAASNADSVNAFLDSYDEDAAGEAITSMFLAPEQLAPVGDGTQEITGGTMLSMNYINPPTYDILPEGATKTDLDISAGTLNGYDPTNKKMLCYPYRYLLVSNNAGGAAIMKYELFYTTDGDGKKTIIDPRFVIEGVLTPGCSIRMIPLNYNGAPRNDEEGINMGKFPILNWSSDVYTNWLTQNGVNIALDLAVGVGQIAAGTAAIVGTAGVGAALGGGTIAGGVSQIAGTLGSIRQASLIPPQAKGNLNSGDVVTASDSNDFHFYDMSIKTEYAKIIDEFFNMYGYKCHRVKIPATDHRSAYWYTKTIDANIVGAIPQSDLETIKACYNKGITFWRPSVVFKDYRVINPIIKGA